MAKVKEAPASNVLVGYVMKTKTKNVPIVDAVINIISGKYFVKGHDGTKEKNLISSIMSGAKAEAAVAAGTAKRGTGWPKK